MIAADYGLLNIFFVLQEHKRITTAMQRITTVNSILDSTYTANAGTRRLLLQSTATWEYF